MKSNTLSVDRMMNQFGEFTKISDVLLFWSYTLIKPLISTFEGGIIKGILSLMIFLSTDFELVPIMEGMFYVPMDLVMLLTLFWCSDIITGLIRAKFIKKQQILPAKILMWFMRGVVYVVGLTLLSAFFNVAGKYFGDIFLSAQAFVFLVVAFTELWSNLRNIFGQNLKHSTLGRAIIGMFSGKPIRDILKEIIENDNTTDTTN